MAKFQSTSLDGSGAQPYLNLVATRWAREQRLGAKDAAGRNMTPAMGSRILLELAFSADASGISKLGQKRLAEACQCSERSVRSWLDALEAFGLIARSHRHRARGGRTSDAITLGYALLPAPGAGDQAARRAGMQAAPGAGNNPQVAKEYLGLRPEVDRHTAAIIESAPLPAPRAGGLPAPGAKLTGTACRVLIEDKINTPLPPLMQEASLAVRDVLTAVGVLPETAEEVMLLHMQQDKPLTVRSAQRLLRSFGASDPETECAAIIARALEAKRSASAAQRVTDAAGERYKPLEVAANRAFAMTCLKLWGDRDGKDRMWMANQAAISVPEGILDAARQKLAASGTKQA